MDRRTRKLLAQMLRQREDALAPSAISRAKPARMAIAERHLDVWDRLGNVRRVNPDPRDMAAGRERMLSALSPALDRRHGIFSLLVLAPVVRSMAIVLAVLVLTGAAAGASAALGGPRIWHTVGVNRGSERAMEEQNSGELDGAGRSSDSAPTDAGSETVAEEVNTTNDVSSGGGDDAEGEDGTTAEESEAYNDGVTAGDTEDSESGQGPGAASSETDDDPDEGGDEEDKHPSTPKINLTPTPNLQDRSNMTYDDDGDESADEADEVDNDVVDDENGDSTDYEEDEEGKGGNPGGSGGAEHRRGPENARQDQERSKGQGQNSQQPSGR